MKKLRSRRKATTLIELVVVLVMMAMFILMVFHIFGVTYSAYLFNREMAAKMYAQTNIDNFFEIFEKELMYSGSMDRIIKGLPGLSTSGSDTPLEIETTENDATITTRYALAEKIILTKAFQDSYDQLENIDGNPLSESEDASYTYFALYDATFPSTETEDTISLWSLGYKSINTTPNATVLKITNFDTIIATRTSDGATFTGVIIEDAEDKNAGTFNISDDLLFISPLLYEKSFNSLNDSSIKLETDKKWTGEIIYKTQIYTIPQEEPKDPDKKTLVLKKYIPTVDALYTIKLVDDVISFQATALTSTTYIATVTYGFELPGTSEEGSITVSRKFLKNIQ